MLVLYGYGERELILLSEGVGICIRGDVKSAHHVDEYLFCYIITHITVTSDVIFLSIVILMIFFPLFCMYLFQLIKCITST